jgi:hypothetical protein
MTSTVQPSSRERFWWWPLVAGALLGLVLRVVIFVGEPGAAYNAMMNSFMLLVPVAVGAVAVYVAERTKRRKWSYYFTAGIIANLLFVAGTLVIMIEGVICAFVVAPLFAIIGGLAGLLTGAIFRWARWPRPAVYSIAALPLIFGAIEQHLPLPNDIQSVERTVFVHATPDRIWPHLLSLPGIRPQEMDDGWMYRIGVPLPLSAATEHRDDELVRHIRMGKAVHFDQIATDWEPNRRVRWVNRYEPDSFPAGALDDHVRIGGHYFDIIDTEYSMREVSGGTELRARMRYRVSTHFNWYARPLARLLIGNFENTALAFYARRAEAVE